MADASLTGTLVGRYRVDARLGAGGMGEIYSAWDSVLERQIALKVLPPHLTADPTRVERLKVEARAASALNHPAIVTIYEIGEAALESTTEVHHFIAMELIDGVTLDAWLATRPALDAIISQLARLAEGIGKAHARGVIHRDLKPENVMITRDGFPKILDFGLAKLVEVQPRSSDEERNNTSRRALTQPAAILGTIGYMAPEQVEALPLDHRTDIFALGCILYESITGAPPFRGETSAETLHAIVHRQPDRIRLDNLQLAERLQRILDRCLAKDREERYDSARDLALDLFDATMRPLAAVTPASTARRLLSHGRRPAVALVAVLIALTLYGSGTAILERGNELRSQKQIARLEAEIERERESRMTAAAALDESEREVARKAAEIQRLETERENGDRLRGDLEQSYRSLLADLRDHVKRNESERSALRQRVTGAETELGRYREELARFNQVEQLERLQRELAPWTDARIDGRRVVLTIPGTLFDTGSARIEPQVLPLVRQLAAQLLAIPELKATIEGHTDSRGAEEQNLRLSQRRADGIRDLMISSGVESSRVTALGRGEQFPAWTNDSIAGRIRNRRVEISLALPAS
ncbi:MAG TPA: protein kinase [Thermoanaerobaculia bacterium]